MIGLSIVTPRESVTARMTNSAFMATPRSQVNTTKHLFQTSHVERITIVLPQMRHKLVTSVNLPNTFDNLSTVSSLTFWPEGEDVWRASSIEWLLTSPSMWSWIIPSETLYLTLRRPTISNRTIDDGGTRWSLGWWSFLCKINLNPFNPSFKLLYI